MKIGISGAQGVGKTTLLNALRSEEYFKNYQICNEITRTIRSYGIDINENGNLTTQLLVMKEHVFNLFMYPDFIADRISLDGIVYTHWIHQQQNLGDDFLRCLWVFEKTIPLYDHIFYIEPEFKIEDDGVRSTSVEWQQEIVELFRIYINEYKLNVTPLTGSVRSRVETILKTISKD